jgi:hypothetical protein
LVAKRLSINVGLPRDVAWRGEKVHRDLEAARAGPDCSPSSECGRRWTRGSRWAWRRAPRGNGYQMDAYRHWEAQVGREDFSFGQFGENFTVDGVPDAEVCIGDRYRIGGVLFEVTQPRVTCDRVGIRMEGPAMAALLVSHHRPGPRAKSSRPAPPRKRCIKSIPSSGSRARRRTPAPTPAASLVTFSMKNEP